MLDSEGAVHIAAPGIQAVLAIDVADQRAVEPISASIYRPRWRTNAKSGASAGTNSTAKFAPPPKAKGRADREILTVLGCRPSSGLMASPHFGDEPMTAPGALRTSIAGRLALGRVRR